MTSNQSHCSVCGAVLEEQKITYTQAIDGKVSIVEDVPVLVCPQCGAIYLAPETVDAIQEQIEHGQTTEACQVPVYRIPQPAS
jgi:YgiT-type zinc finger domain-containing protein